MSATGTDKEPTVEWSLSEFNEMRLDQAVFDELRSLIYAKSGITLGENKMALVSARVGKRLRALRIADYRAYLEFVKEDASGDELIQLLDVISTNVTSFFREADHFTLMDEIMNGWIAEGRRKFRLWSAASSSGEEPYSIAMKLRELERVHSPTALDLKILATDISTKVLGLCMEGVYESGKVETVPLELRKRYFDRVNNERGECYKVKDSLKSLCLFKRLNLSVAPFPMKGPMDIILCRNVMIYFDKAVRSRLISEMYRLLRPGGYLMVGHAESLTGLETGFKPVRPSVYIKK